VKYRLRPEALADLEEVWLYTAREWGIDQADRYVASVIARIEAIAERPNSGSPISETLMGYRKVRSGHHLAIYRATKDEVIVVRVLHEREDLTDGYDDP